MKTKALTLIFFFSILYCKSQVIESIGIKGGVSFANQTWKIEQPNITNKYEYKTGIYSVLTAEFFKSRFLSLSTDIGLVQKGMKQDLPITSVEFPDGNGESILVKTTMDYISFSPMLKCFYTIKNLTSYALIGPRIDYRVGYNSEYKQKIISDMKKVTLGFSYGVGAEYKINNIGILLEFLGHPDFSNIMEIKPTETTTGLNITEKVYSISTGIKYYMH